MYTKLKITVDGQVVSFHAHEIIKISLDLMNKQSKVISNTTPLILKNAEPDYSMRFKEFSRDISTLYEKKYEVKNGDLNTFLNELYELSTYAPSLIPAYIFFSAKLIEHIKNKKETESNFQGFLNKDVKTKFLPLPDAIKQIDSIEKWIYLANNLSATQEETPIIGWWSLLADRFIHINYDPNNRENLKRKYHFYVSDHGELDDVYKQVERETINNNLPLHGLNMAMLNFTKFYERLNDTERNKLRKNFTNEARKFDINDDKKMQLLLTSFAYPAYSREDVISGEYFEDEPTNPNITQSMVRWAINTSQVYIENRPNYLDDVKVDELLSDVEENDEYEKNENVFQKTLEPIQYQTQKIRSYYKWLMDNLQVAFAQEVNKVMYPQDAEIYIECRLLTTWLQKINLGDRSMLFRPITSYGNKNEGSSYHDFERAFANYLKQENHLSESELALVMRKILRGETPDVTNCPFIPNLTGAWFIAESARNPLSIMSGLMLLDMIENNIKLLDEHGNNWYSWCNTLIHPLKNLDKKKVFDLYGKEKEIDKFGGSHPMAHDESVKGSLEKTIRPNIPLTPVRQKEASLMMHWLQLRLIEVGVSCELVNVAEEKLQHENTNFDEVCEEQNDSERVKTLKNKINKLEGTIRVKQKTNKDSYVAKEKNLINKFMIELNPLIKKQQIQQKLLVPHLLSRLSSLDNLLKPERNIVISDNQSLHNNDSQDEKISLSNTNNADNQQQGFLVHRPSSTSSAGADRIRQTATPLPVTSPSPTASNLTSPTNNLR